MAWLQSLAPDVVAAGLRWHFPSYDQEVTHCNRECGQQMLVGGFDETSCRGEKEIGSREKLIP